MHQCDGAGQGAGRDGLGFQVEDLVVDICQLGANLAVGKVVIVLVNHFVVGAVALGRGGGTAERNLFTPITEDVIPDRLKPILGNGERTGHDGISHAVAVIQQLCAQGIFERPFVDMPGEGCRPARLVNRHKEFRPVLFKHPDMAIRQHITVLIHVIAGNGIKWLVFRERINLLGSLSPVCRWCCQAAVPGRNSAFGITGAFGTDRCELIVQPLCFGR